MVKRLGMLVVDDRVVFLNTPSAILVDIDVKLKL